MPIYEYQCEECCARFEVKRRFGEDGGASCPHCKAKARRLFSTPAIIFKGSGFYVTDSRGKTAPEESKPEKAEAKKESKSK